MMSFGGQEQQPPGQVNSKENSLEADEEQASGQPGGQYSDQQTIDEECEKLLKNAKKQVKQMMEEAVTKKFIREDSSSITSFCVAVDACLSHGLKRRALGLFKTSSSTALIQKAAKSCKDAQLILELVSCEEKKLLDEQQTRKASSANQQQASSLQSGASLSQQQQAARLSPVKAVASNLGTHRRNLWIKCALIEKKLVAIVEFLAENAPKFYEPEALMSNYLCSQILASLLVGPSALEFSSSKLQDCYQFEEPSAEELLKRHKLANPIACLCSQSSQNLSKSADLAAAAAAAAASSNQQTNHCGRQLRVGSSSLLLQSSNDERCSQEQPRESSPTRCAGSQQHQLVSRTGSSNSSANNNNSNSNSNNPEPNHHRLRRRPLALKTNSIKRGTLVTDCHHYSCQEMSEHQHPRGYSIYCPSSEALSLANSAACASNQPANAGSASSNGLVNNNNNNNTLQQANPADWSQWSPRMLHETLHQNSRSKLLYAKNNVLLETQPNETMAGYLSLHQSGADLILKWIPNQMINGGQLSSCRCSRSDEQAEENEACCCRDHDNQTKTNKQAVQQQQQQQQHQVAVESSCLDLVVNLSVSRIVLLHCQFEVSAQKNYAQQQLLLVDQPIAEQSSSNNSSINTSDGDSNTATSKEQPQEQQPVELRDLSAAAGARVPSSEETLILIEADGVQRSPFKFPKGGLRLFLSCLESGLKPDKYLDPAIRFDECGVWPEPLLDNLESPSASEASSTSSSRFDLLLKRLPSLKRKPTSELAPLQNCAESSDSSSLAQEAPKQAGEAAKQQQQQQHQLTTNNYVYRIVSVQQPEWPLPTPPHSALSVGSSSSGSVPLSAMLPAQQVANQQKFRWSLSRLARFSARYRTSGNDSTNSSISVSGHSCATANGSFAGAGGQQMENSASETTSLDPTVCFETNPDKFNNDSSSQQLARVEAKLHLLKESTSDADILLALRTQSIQTLCESMRKQILARAFYGWLAYCRRAKIINAHLVRLVKEPKQCFLLEHGQADYELAKNGLTRNIWHELMSNSEKLDELKLCHRVSQLVYYGGIESDELRKEVWPYLLSHYKFRDSEEEKRSKDEAIREAYEACGRDWIQIERVVKQRDREILAANIAKVNSGLMGKGGDNKSKISEADSEESCAEKSLVATKQTSLDTNNNNNNKSSERKPAQKLEAADEEETSLGSLQEQDDNETQDQDKAAVERKQDAEDEKKAVKTPEDNKRQLDRRGSSNKSLKLQAAEAKKRRRRRPRLESTGSVGSDASITDQFGNNIHRIDKDVQRCDRSFWYFKEMKNLDKLRNIMCTYVWQHLDVGYVQGMCDLAAPFLVIFDDEILAYICFSQLMKRMVSNFPHGGAMDQHFESLKYLMQVLDPKLFEVLQNNGDYTHFYFCYRWLLLDFKRELAYEDVYRVWETIWSARNLVSDQFVIFMALAMVRYYRDIIIENNMDFTDTIKFFNGEYSRSLISIPPCEVIYGMKTNRTDIPIMKEMAERHNAEKIMALARDSIVELQNLVWT